MGCVPELLVSPEGEWRQAGRVEQWFWEALLGLVDLRIGVTNSGIRIVWWGLNERLEPVFVFKICEGPEQLRTTPALSYLSQWKFRMAITAPSWMPVHYSTDKANYHLMVP